MQPENMTIVPRVSGKVGRYRVLSELGRGAMGRVYLAEDPNIGRRIALKVLYPEAMDIQATKEFRKRFVTEARAAGRLNHSGIVTVYDAGTDPETGHSFIAMELVEGKPLEELLGQQRRLPAATAVAVASEVARALDYAHRQGVVHRDIKPANILLGAEGQVKVTDFGVAKLGVGSQTMAGQILGTPAFMSPEQVRSEPIDGRSDLFSLGTVLYQCLTGQNPFSADSIASISYKIVNADPAPVQAYDPDLPDALAAVVDRALKKLPEERFESGAELAEALASLGTLPESQPPLGAAREPDAGKVAERDPSQLGATVVAAGRTEETSPGQPDADGRPAVPKIRWRVAGAALAVLLLGLGLTAFIVGRSSEPVGEEGPALVRPSPEPVGESAALVRRSPEPVGESEEGPALVRRSPEPVGESGSAVVADDRATTPPPGEEEEQAGETEDQGDPLPEPADLPEAAAPEEPADLPEAAAPEEPADLPEVAAPEEPAAASAPAATLELRHENHLRQAWMSVWIDGERVWSEEMIGPKSVFKRALGQKVRATISTSAGRHLIEVRISEKSMKVDAGESIRASFSAGETRQLEVSLKRRSNQLRLSWVE